MILPSANGGDFSRVGIGRVPPLASHRLKEGRFLWAFLIRPKRKLFRYRRMVMACHGHLQQSKKHNACLNV